MMLPPILGGLMIGGLSLLAAWVFARGLRQPRAAHEDSVTLIMALTGPALQLPALLRALDRQTLPARRLIIAVESVEDPAEATIRAAVGSTGCRLPVETVVAGAAEQGGQKCANLVAALDRVDDQDRVLVFLDADILPQPWWLSALVAPLQDGTSDLVSGYRWPTIRRHRLGAHAILAIDRTIAVLPRLRWASAVWGGSLAMRRETVERLGLRTHLRQVLSDDLAIGQRAAQAGLRILIRRALRVPSPVDADLWSAWRFGRRQYQMIRLHRPRLWFFALGTVTLQVAAWIAITLGLPDAGLALAVGVMLLVFTVVQRGLLFRIGHRLGATDPPTTLAVQSLLCLAKPLLDLFHWSMILAAARVERVTWGHVRYAVRAPDRISVLSRTPWPSSDT